MTNTLLPGYNRPVPQVRVVDRELLQVAQESARRRRNWDCANGLLRMAYGCEQRMKTQQLKAVLLRNNDQIVDVDGLLTVTDFKMNMLESIVTFTATKPDKSSSRRWMGMDTYVEKVML